MKTIKKQKRQYTTYREATKELDLVLCNDITKYHKLTNYTYRIEDYIDDEIIKEVNESKLYNTDEERQEAIREKAIERIYEDNICQLYLTNASKYDVEYLTNTYGLQFAYCQELGIWVLLVNDRGLSWDDATVEVK